MRQTTSPPRPAWQAPPDPLTLGDDEVHVWRVPLAPAQAELGRLRRLLAPAETARAARFHFPRDRNRFIAARGRLRTVLAWYLRIPPGEVRFGYGARGKPFLVGPNEELEFNAADSADLALFAVARRRPVGVDVEFTRRPVDEEQIAARFFSPREVAALRSLPAPERRLAFFNCWTRKEAYLKAIGEGLGFGLDRFTVSLAPDEAPALLETPFDPGEARHWQLYHLEPGHGYVGALAVRGAVSRLSLWRYPSEPGDNV